MKEASPHLAPSLPPKKLPGLRTLQSDLAALSLEKNQPASEPPTKKIPLKKVETPPIAPIVTSQSIPVTPSIKAIPLTHSQNQPLEKVAVETDPQQFPTRIIITPEKKHHRVFFVSLIGLGIVVIGCISFIVYRSNRQPGIQNVIATPSSSSIINTDYTQKIMLSSSDSVAEKILSSSLSEYKQNTLIYLYFSDAEREAVLNAEQFSYRLAPTLPQYLARSFNPLFVAGIYNQQKPLPFIIFKTDSYETTFAGMLAWEKTMTEDLLPLMTVDLSSNLSRSFQDTIIKNKDVRVLKDDAGTSLLLYSFFDKHTLIIATSEDTFKEIVARLNTSSYAQ